MTVLDWFSPRIDGSLHWQQSLAITLVGCLIGGPAWMWWTYDTMPKSVARDAVAERLGPQSGFRITRVLNELATHDGLVPHPLAASTLVCGTAQIEGDTVPVAVLANRRRHGYLRDIAVITPWRPESGRYPDAAPVVLEFCAREARLSAAEHPAT